jgi:hypothetical protein
VTSDPERPRTSGRHAAPRLTVRGRMQLPVGRALALTAVPTALLMGSIAPRFAFAADATKAVPVSSTVHEASAAKGVDCGTPTGGGIPVTAKTSGQAASGQAARTTARTTADNASDKAASAGGAAKQAGSGTHTTAGSAPTASASPSPTASRTPSPSATPSATPGHRNRPEPVKTILNTLGGILAPLAQPQATTAKPRTATAPKADAATTAPAPTATPTATPTTATTATTASTPTSAPTPTSKPTGGTLTRPAPGSTSTAKAADPAASAKAAANRICDAADLAAPLDTSVPTGGMPTYPWTLKTSRLALGSAQFWGVRMVDTAAGPVKVLKFTAQTVQIDNLDMSVNQNGQLLHVQGGPSTTSTIEGGTVTMYVTSLSGTLSKAEGIPLAELGVKLTLTPDSLPEWLYDLVGSVPVPLDLELNDATAIQTGQFGGDLTIPGMHLYYTPLS